MYPSNSTETDSNGKHSPNGTQPALSRRSASERRHFGISRPKTNGSDWNWRIRTAPEARPVSSDSSAAPASTRMHLKREVRGRPARAAHRGEDFGNAAAKTLTCRT